MDLTVGFAGDYLKSHAKGGVTKEFNDLVMNDSHDILVLGSSRALHHYDTPFLSDTLDLAVYNAGHKGNGSVLAAGILEMALGHSSPRLIIYDVEPAYDIYEYDDDNDKRYLASLKPYYRVPEVGDIFRAVSKKEWVKVHSGLFRFNTSIITMTVDNIIGRAEPSKGFSPLSGALEGDGKALVDSNRPVDPVKLRFVEKMILTAKTAGVPVVFIASPKLGSEDSCEFEPVKRICGNYNVPFLDYYSSREFNSHKEWFYDPVHLNAAGARHFSEIIAKDIRTLL